MNISYTYVIPTYNSEKYLKTCLDSLNNQTYTNIEVLIIDKSSIDKTSEIINSFDTLNIKLLNQKDDHPENAVALGFKKSTGDFIQFLGSDDFLADEDSLYNLNKLISKDDMLVCCDYFKVNEKQEIIEKVKTNFDFKKLLNIGNDVCATSFLFNRKLFDMHGYDGLEGFDLHLMLRFGRNYRVNKINLFYSCFRVHNQSHSGNFKKNLRNIKLDYKISMNHNGFKINNYALRFFLIYILDKLNLLWLAKLKRFLNWKIKKIY